MKISQRKEETMEENKAQQENKQKEVDILNFKPELFPLDRIRAIEDYIEWCDNRDYSADSLYSFLEYKRKLVKEAGKLGNKKE